MQVHSLLIALKCKVTSTLGNHWSCELPDGCTCECGRKAGTCEFLPVDQGRSGLKPAQR
jgi:hypothetical protein